MSRRRTADPERQARGDQRSRAAARERPTSSLSLPAKLWAELDAIRDRWGLRSRTEAVARLIEQEKRRSEAEEDAAAVSEATRR